MRLVLSLWELRERWVLCGERWIGCVGLEVGGFGTDLGLERGLCDGCEEWCVMGGFVIGFEERRERKNKLVG